MYRSSYRPSILAQSALLAYAIYWSILRWDYFVQVNPIYSILIYRVWLYKFFHGYHFLYFIDLIHFCTYRDNIYMPYIYSHDMYKNCFELYFIEAIEDMKWKWYIGFTCTNFFMAIISFILLKFWKLYLNPIEVQFIPLYIYSLREYYTTKFIICQ